MKAVIMAGGKGTRLRPLTCHVPKPMVPLTGRPCMEYIIDLLKAHGIADIAVTVQYLPDVIRDYFGDGSEFGVRLHYFEETTPLGTAGSVKNAESFLDETFIVISGDALTDFDLTEAVRFHRRNGSLSTLVLAQAEHPLEYGVVMTNPDGRVVRFLEKPSWSEVFSDTVNTGIYILEPEILQRIEPGIEYDFSNQLFPGLLAERKPLFGYIAPGYWSDIGSLQQYRQTQFDMLDGRVKVNIRGKEIQPGIYVGEGVTAGTNVKWTGPAYIGDGSRIDDGVEIGEYCIVGKNNVLAKDSVLGRSILWDHNHIAEKNELLGSTLASRIVCKESSQLSDGSVVGSHCVLGPKTVVQPGVKIWPKKQIREHSRLTSSFIWGDHSGKTLYKSFGVTGLPNVEITPEFTARFATAYGATLAAGRTITVSSSHGEFARLLKRTAAAALQSVGVDVIDLGDVLPPVARFAVRELQTAGGLHVQLGETRAECRFECYDEKGLPIGKAAERKVENSYWQEDYGRAATGALGRYRTVNKLSEAYLKTVLAATAFPTAAGSRFRLVVSAHPGVFGLLRPLLNQLHCELVHLPSPLQRDQLAETTRALGADLGLWLDDDGRGMALYMPEGERIADERLTVLQYVSFFHGFPGARIGAPGSAPMLLDSLAAGLGCMLIRTKESIRSVMEASGGLALHPLFDGLFAIGLILQNMNRSGLSVQGLLELIPAFYLQRERIECPWDRKGLVMRRLMQAARDQEVELLDGIKFHHDDGSVLLLPDSDDPTFNLIAQGEHPERLTALVHQYREQILNFLQ